MNAEAQGTLHHSRRRGRHGGRLLGFLGLLVLVSLAITTWIVAHPAAPAMAFPPGAVGALRTDGGLQFALSVPRGPYFRTELLPVTLVLTNNSGHAVGYVGTLQPARCMMRALSVSISSNGQGLEPLATAGAVYYCPLMRLRPTVLPAGRSLQVRVLLGLPSSGRITLAGQVAFAPVTQVPAGGVLTPHALGGLLDGLRGLVPGLFQSGHTPFADGGPSLAIQVSAAIPPSKTLHLLRRGHAVYASGYQRRQPPLVGQEGAVYYDGTGGCPMGTPDWTPLVGRVLRDLPSASNYCTTSPPHEKWQVLVGAPGYAIAGAVYCFNPTPAMMRPGFLGPPCTQTIHE